MELELPVHTNVACKLVVLGENDSSSWEPGEHQCCLWTHHRIHTHTTLPQPPPRPILLGVH